MASRLKFFMGPRLSDRDIVSDSGSRFAVCASRYNQSVSILAIDYGARRIGIAISESGVLATPHSVIRNEGDVVETLARLAAYLHAETIVLGFRRRQHADQREQIFRVLADRLRQNTCNEV